MLYNASEAHLFRLKRLAWGYSYPLLVPDSFSKLGATAPHEGIDTLAQGESHLKGTDVCHAAFSGVRLDCSFDNHGDPFPPVLHDEYRSSDSFHELHGNWSGYSYYYDYTDQRFGYEWSHQLMDVRLDWDTPPSVTEWQVDRSSERWQQVREILVTAIYNVQWTGWITSSKDKIAKAPHRHYVEKYQYGVSQIRYYDDNWKLTYETLGAPTEQRSPASWNSLKYVPFKLDEKFQFIRDVCEDHNEQAIWYKFNQGPKASAFLKAVEGFPSLDSNSWANLIEIIGLLKDLKRGNFTKAADVPQKWYEWWLQYRYRYTTTKSDVESLAKLRKSLHSFHESFGEYRRNVYGTFVDGSTGITWRCEVQAVNRAASQVEQIYHGFETMGFGLSFYNLWDIIPYSFVVDWILPVGDVLESMQRNEYLSSDYWDYESICYSASYNHGVSGDSFAISASVYDRWYEPSPPNLNQYYWFEEHSKSTSAKTGIFRLIDGLSLLVARR